MACVDNARQKLWAQVGDVLVRPHKRRPRIGYRIWSEEDRELVQRAEDDLAVRKEALQRGKPAPGDPRALKSHANALELAIKHINFGRF